MPYAVIDVAGNGTRLEIAKKQMATTQPGPKARVTHRQHGRMVNIRNPRDRERAKGVGKHPALAQSRIDTERERSLHSRWNSIRPLLFQQEPQ